MRYPNIHEKDNQKFLFVERNSHGIVAYNLTTKKKLLVNDIEIFSLLCSEPNNVTHVCRKYVEAEDLKKMLDCK